MNGSNVLVLWDPSRRLPGMKKDPMSSHKDHEIDKDYDRDPTENNTTWQWFKLAGALFAVAAVELCNGLRWRIMGGCNAKYDKR